MKKTIFTYIFLLLCSLLFAKPANLLLLEKAYPDVKFDCKYDSRLKDFFITTTLDNRTAEFYWAEGRMLPEKELSNKANYRPIFYSYSKNIPDPKDFTPEDIERIKNFSSTENRQKGAGMSPFFYDFIYDSSTRIKVEQHITSTTFLGKNSNIHSRIKEPLKKVETRILELAKQDEEVDNFVKTLSRADCYNWREISDSGKKSTHSMGIAFDVLPKGWGQKNVYWAWRRDIDKDNWMLLPLERRWFPPQKVIEIFEEEGFIYGGKWIIWDNMHFEYFPEVILYSQNNQKH